MPSRRRSRQRALQILFLCDARKQPVEDAIDAYYGALYSEEELERDPFVMDLVRGEGARLYPVGRLDYLSEGLLLLTNDGALAEKLTRASSHVPKTYLVKVSGKPPAEAIERLRQGIMLPPEDRHEVGKPQRAVRTAPAEIHLSRDAENPWYEVTLTEGRNRQIRRMFKQVGYDVEKIRRVRYGPLALDVEPGEHRRLLPHEVEVLMRAPRSAPPGGVRFLREEAAKKPRFPKRPGPTTAEPAVARPLRERSIAPRPQRPVPPSGEAVRRERPLRAGADVRRERPAGPRKDFRPERPRPEGEGFRRERPVRAGADTRRERPAGPRKDFRPERPRPEGEGSRRERPAGPGRPAFKRADSGRPQRPYTRREEKPFDRPAGRPIVEGRERPAASRFARPSRPAEGPAGRGAEKRFGAKPFRPGAGKPGGFSGRPSSGRPSTGRPYSGRPPSRPGREPRPPR